MARKTDPKKMIKEPVSLSPLRLRLAVAALFNLASSIRAGTVQNSRFAKFQTYERASHRREPHVLSALGLTLLSGPINQIGPAIRDLPSRLRLPGDLTLAIT